MKKTFQIIALAICAFAFAACEMHDFIDENVITGAVGPEATWEIESSAIKAGESMGFSAQYYSAVAAIDSLEVWYSISESVGTTVNCSWLTHSNIKSVKEMKRVLQFIQGYSHSEEFKDDSLHAYVFEGSFPVSGTLSPVSWVKPAEFDSTKMIAFFGENFMQEFKDAVKEKMTYSVYKEKFTALGFINDFSQFTDSSYDWNVSSDSTVAKYYHFPLDENGKVQAWVMDTMNYYWDQVTFDQLILASDGTYDVTYNREYSLDAELRVYDEHGTYSKTTSKEIVIN